MEGGQQPGSGLAVKPAQAHAQFAHYRLFLKKRTECTRAATN